MAQHEATMPRHPHHERLGSQSPPSPSVRSDRRSAPQTRFQPLPVDRLAPRGSGAYVPPVLRDVAWVPTEADIVRQMLLLAEVNPQDVVIDLGCGDGRIVIAAARDHGATGVGIDIDPVRIKQCHENARLAKVEHRVTFVEQNLYQADVSRATVLMLYLLPGMNAKLRPRLLSQMRPGTRIVSNHFDMGDWRPDAELAIGRRNLYRWNVPVFLSGRWRCTLNSPGRDSNHDHVRMTLTLQGNYQFVSGSAMSGQNKMPLKEGRLAGNQFTFMLSRMTENGTPMRFRGTIEHKTVRGTCWIEGQEDAPMEWGGLRD